MQFNRPVFERLRELEIPQEANTDLPDTKDMSLVHELGKVGIGFLWDFKFT